MAVYAISKENFERRQLASDKECDLVYSYAGRGRKRAHARELPYDGPEEVIATIR